MSDIIDDLVAERGVHSSRVSALLARAVSEIERLREERRWIPVGERLPEHCDIVWVYDGTDVVIGEYWGTWESYGASCDREGLNSKTLAGITHWAEIVPPQPPPKGGEVE